MNCAFHHSAPLSPLVSLPSDVRLTISEVYLWGGGKFNWMLLVVNGKEKGKIWQW